nr:MAG TPA: hypothetical protein [Caudoviricetes sp.]
MHNKSLGLWFSPEDLQSLAPLFSLILIYSTAVYP